LQRLFRLTLGLAKDHEIVRIAHESIAQRLQTPVEMVQDDIGQ
jgi:hypothetical protein